MSQVFRIVANHFDSLNVLFLHVVILQGDKEIYKQVIAANETDQVVQLFDEGEKATGDTSNAIEQMLADHVFKARAWWEKKQKDDQVAGGFQTKFFTSADLEKLDVRHRWLVKNMLVRDQPALLGGPKKSMKTSIALDLAISLGSGKPFLGKFEVPEKVKVLVLSGESGQSTIKESALRIAKSKDAQLSACDVLWGFDLPRLGVDADLQALSAGLRDNAVKVVLIDPAYLCLLAGAQDVQANNMFQVGPLLARVSKICADAGATLILLHHTTKNGGMQQALVGEPLELEHLAYAGFSEFARQWAMINRRQKYEAGSGSHQLWLNIGGSAGHSACWAVDVEEGKLNDDFSGRQWLVKVRSVEEAKKAVTEAKEKQKEVGQKAKLEEDMEKIVKALETVPNGETQSVIAAMTGMQPRVVGPAMQELVRRGKVMGCKVMKTCGKGEKPTDAWRLTTMVEFHRSKMEASKQIRSAEQNVGEQAGAVTLTTSTPAKSGNVTSAGIPADLPGQEAEQEVGVQFGGGKPPTPTTLKSGNLTSLGISGGLRGQEDDDTDWLDEMPVASATS